MAIWAQHAALLQGTELLRLIRQDEVDQGAEGYAGGAFGEPGLGVVVPGGAGDVEVNPGRVAGEFLDEHGTGDGAAGFGAGEKLVGERLVRAEDADVDVGESDDDSAGERGGVDEMGGTELLGVVD